MSAVLATGSPGDAGDFQVIQGWARDTGWLHGFMSGYAVYGVALFGVLVVAGWWLARRRGDLPGVAAVVWTAAGTLIAVGINQVIGHTVAEPRPYQALPHVLLLIGRSTDYSFTSDHATMAGALATGLLFVNRRLGIFTWCAAILLAFARVYVGAHYPHDVVAGLGLGTAVVVVGRTVAQPVLAWLVTRLAETPLRPLVTARARTSGLPFGQPGDPARAS